MLRYCSIWLQLAIWYNNIIIIMHNFNQCCLKQEHVISGLSSCGKDEFLVLRKGLAESVKDGQVDKLLKLAQLKIK